MDVPAGNRALCVAVARARLDGGPVHRLGELEEWLTAQIVRRVVAHRERKRAKRARAEADT